MQTTSAPCDADGLRNRCDMCRRNRRPLNCVSAAQRPFLTWRVMDSNQRRTTPTVLQSGGPHASDLGKRAGHPPPPHASRTDSRNPSEMADTHRTGHDAIARPSDLLSQDLPSLCPRLGCGRRATIGSAHKHDAIIIVTWRPLCALVATDSRTSGWTLESTPRGPRTTCRPPALSAGSRSVESSRTAE